MKKLVCIIFGISHGLFFSAAHSAGFDCQALCIGLDSVNHVVYFFGELDIQAGTSRARIAHRLLKKQCKEVGTFHGLPTLLVDELKYSSGQEMENESYHSLQSQQSQSLKNQEQWARAPRTRYHNYDLEWASSHAESIVDYARDYQSRNLEIEIIPSVEGRACVLDETITSGQIPYLGNIGPLL